MTTRPTFAVQVHADARAAASAVVDELLAVVVARREAGAGACLALPTGRTPVPVYAELVARVRAGVASLAGCRLFALDEYHPIEPDHPASFTRFLREHLLDHVDLGDGSARTPDGGCAHDALAAHCAGYRAAIAAAGGLDLALLGVGGNGHVAFNEPGSARDAGMARVALAASTREAAAAAFGGLEAVPTHGLSLGLADLCAARRVVIMATGAGKADVVARLLGAEGVALPAGQVLEASDGLLVLDAAAAARLARRD